jgi:DNA polymerase-3 subunit delta'
MAKKAAEEDDAPSVPHPREVAELFGHSKALETMRSAVSQGRMHHAWILAGPRGIGKATFAFRIARYLLKYGASERGPKDFAMDPSDPIFRTVAAQSNPDLLVLTRPWDHDKKRFRTELPVDEVRRLQHFFSQHASAGGARVAIIDTADEMNRNAANALLKALEEPPQNAFLFLVSNAPGTLIPTIRSRCRMLALQPLDNKTLGEVLVLRAPDAKTLAREKAGQLSGGSPGRALELIADGGLETYDALIATISAWPQIDMRRVQALANESSGRGSESAFIVLGELLLDILSRAIRSAADPGGEMPAQERKLAQKLMANVGVDRWLLLWENVAALLASTDEANLDKRQAVVTAFAWMSDLRSHVPPDFVTLRASRAK